MPVLEARCSNVSVSTCTASRPAGSTRSSLGLGETQSGSVSPSSLVVLTSAAASGKTDRLTASL